MIKIYEQANMTFPGWEDSIKTRGVRVLVEKGTLFIGVEGYSDSCSVDGEGFVLSLEIYEGRLMLAVWNDVNRDECSHRICLENAKELLREEE